MQPLQGDSNGIAIDGVLGTNPVLNGTGAGVHGLSKNVGPGVLGESTDGRGVQGKSTNNYGVRAHSDKSAGIRASSTEGRGAEGWSIKSEGVVGISTNGTGVWGQTEGAGNGVLGTSKTGQGVWGESETKGIGTVGKSKGGIGVFGVSETYEAIHAETKSPDTAAIAAYNLNPNGTGAAIFAKKEGSKGHAGFFVGDVFVTGTLGVKVDIVLANADFAEDFTVVDQTEPGEVMVLTEDGTLTQSTKAYDKKVVGILSGAGSYKPGIILDKQNNNANRKPIAMMGKVFCKVDADASPVETGDMLTTSDIPGYAMKAIDPFRAFGAVIGKALASLSEGKGLIPVLVVLQ